MRGNGILFGPLTLTLSPRNDVDLLKTPLAGERGPVSLKSGTYFGHVPKSVRSPRWGEGARRAGEGPRGIKD